LVKYSIYFLLLHIVMLFVVAIIFYDEIKIIKNTKIGNKTANINTNDHIEF